MDELDLQTSPPEEESPGLAPLYNRHYVAVDARSRIVDGWSDGPHTGRDTAGAVCINEQGGYQFRLEPGGEENPPLWDMMGVPLYKWEGGQILPRTEQELEADRAALPAPPPSPQEDADAWLVDHEYRLTLLELGVGEEV